MQFEECKNKLFSCKHCLRGTYTMYEYEKPKYKLLNRPLILFQLHPTPAAHLSSRLYGSPHWSPLLSSRSHLPIWPSPAPRTAPPLAPSRVRPLRPSAKRAAFPLQATESWAVRASWGLTLHSPPRMAQDSGALQCLQAFSVFLRTLSPVCRSFVKPRNGASPKQSGLPLLLKRHRASDQNRGHCQTSDVAVVHQDDERRSLQTSEVAWVTQKSL